MPTNLALLLCAAAISGAAADVVVSYSVPAFNATTTTTSTVDHLATSNSANYGFLFSFTPGYQDSYGSMLDSTGFLLLDQLVESWRVGEGEQRALEASFNTSFTLGGAKPIAFVVLLDSIPISGNEGNYTVTEFASSKATGGTAAVQVGPVMSYGDNKPDVGLNVTVTPHGPALAVWIEYDAGAHCLFVYVSGGRQPKKPSKALIDWPLYLIGRTTETAYIGFFAARVRDVIVGVRDWNLTVDRFPVNGEGVGNGNKITSWLVVLLAVLGSVVCYF